MARIRTIKPEFWTSEQVVECSLNARLLFIGLWNFCDDHGRHSYSCKQIKALVFPADDLTVAEVQSLMEELETARLIQAYEVADKRYFFVTGWQHQKIDRPQKERFPAPVSTNIPRPLDEHSPNARDGRDEGKEGKGKDLSSSSSAGAPVRSELEIEVRQMVGQEPVLLDTNFTPILGLLVEGITAADVISGVRDALAKRRRRFQCWEEFVTWIRRAAKDRLAETPRPASTHAPRSRDGPGQPATDEIRDPFLRAGAKYFTAGNP